MKRDIRYVAISEIWTRRFCDCSDANMTPDFPNSVWRFYHSLLNLDEGKLAIKDKVKKYVETEWYPKINNIVSRNTIETNDSDTIALERRLTEAQYIHELFSFIIQTIQDSGIGWQSPSSGKGYYVGADNIEEFTGESG